MILTICNLFSDGCLFLFSFGGRFLASAFGMALDGSGFGLGYPDGQGDFRFSYFLVTRILNYGSYTV